MVKREMELIVAVALLGVSVLAAAAEPIAAPGVNESLNRVNLGRQEIDRMAKEKVSSGNRLFADGKYFDARDQYLSAIKLLKSFPGEDFADRLEYCRRQILLCYMNQAEQALDLANRRAEARDYEDAIRICKEALEYYPEDAVRINERIALYDKKRSAAATRASLSEEKLIPDQKSEEYQIQVKLEQGRRYMNVNETARAAQCFNEILLIDPYNADALQCLKAAYNRLRKSGSQREDMTHREAEVVAAWKLAVPNHPVAAVDTGVNYLSVPVNKESEKLSQFQQKLDNIIIPSINFSDGVSPASAIKYLRDQSRLNDPSGVGINLHFRKVQQAKAAADSAEEEEEELEDEDTSSTDGIVLNMRDASVLKVLKAICRKGKLNYRIDDNMVVVAPEGVPLEGLRRQFYSVAEDVLAKSIEGEISSDTLKKFFEGVGVKFPQGSRIIYDGLISQLIAVNTPDNLEKIGKLLQEIDQREPMVQVMVKVIEMDQKDLKELAFNYQYAVNSAGAIGTAENGLTRGRWSTNDSSNQLMRYYRDAEDTTSTADELANLSFNYEDSSGNLLKINLFALNQASSSDVIFSPRVTTLSGQTAHISMVKERYFPSEWETVDMPSTDSSSSEGSSRYFDGKRADPQPVFDDDPEQLGITFNITPVADPDPDRRTITAAVDFPIKTFFDWMIFDARTTNSDGTVDGEYYKMPIFNNRTIKTNVTVYDGETVVLGGIVIDNITDVNDKIPVLGDLPVIGRLFQSKYTDSDKQNLLVFLTFRMVKPDGSALFPDSIRSKGLPVMSRSYGVQP